MRRTLSVLLVLAAAVFVRAEDAKPAPDVLLFANGDQLTGKLVRSVGSTVVFKSDMAGEITVGLDKVREIRSAGEFAVLRKGRPGQHTTAGEGQVRVAEGQVTITQAAGAPVSLPVADVGYVVDRATYDRQIARRAGPLEGWNGSITAGFNAVRSTQSGTTINAAINLVRTIPTVPYLPARNRTTMNVSESYGKLVTPVIPQTTPASLPVIVKTDIFHADAERDQYFSPAFYALGQAVFDHNYSQGLYLQSVYGGGVGWTPIKDAKQQLDVKADVHFERQEFLASTQGGTAAADQELFGSTFAETYRRALPHKLVLTESASYLPAWNNMVAYSANASVALAVPVFKRLGLSMSATDNYLNNPPPFYRTNSYQVVTGITYTLH